MTISFYVKITASKQGSLASESTRRGFTDQIPGIAFSYEVAAPRSAAGSGPATGKAQHGPVTFTKSWGAASPQIFQALTSNELLPSVVFDFLRVSANGVEEVFHTITLTNARVSSIRKHIDADTAGGQDLEEIAFVFASIELRDKPSGTSWSVTVGP